MADETTDGMNGQDAASKIPKNTGGTPPTPAGIPTQAGAPQHIAGAPVSVPPATPALAPTPIQTPLSAPAPAQVSPVQPPQKNMADDMAKILKEVKLPERRETELAGERVSKKEVKDIDTLLNAPAASTVAAQAAPVPASQTAPETQPTEKSSVQSLHTLKQDLQHVVTEQKISVVRAVALEEDRRAAQDEPTPIEHPGSNRVKNIFFAATLLIVLGAAAFGGVYMVMSDRAEKLPAPISDSLVFAERTVTLSLDNQSTSQLKRVLEEARSAQSASLGSITRILPVKTNEMGETQPVTLARFFQAIGARPPDQLARALASDFFFGLHTIDKNAPLLVIPVVSYDNAFAGMLAWENSINTDLAPVYAAVPALIAGADGIPQRRVFVDDVMRNYDVRELKNDAGAIVLYYAFPTRNLLIIAESPYTFTELLSRLQAQRNL